MRRRRRARRGGSGGARRGGLRLRGCEILVLIHMRNGATTTTPWPAATRRRDRINLNRVTKVRTTRRRGRGCPAEV